MILRNITPYRTLLYLVKRKRKYRKLIIPFSFFILESSLVLLITLNIFGYNIFNMNERFVAEPMVYIRLIHSPEVFENVEYISANSFIKYNNNISPLISFANFTSIFIAFIGMLIALLWMNRFFKLNQINIEWWIWPTGCLASHFLFLLIFI